MKARRRARWTLRLLTAAWLSLASCSPGSPTDGLTVQPVRACDEVPWDGIARRRNVVLVVNDTMRRDRLGLYGGAARTPAFDAFAEGGFHFTNLSSQAPWTKPSIATLFTGLHPSQHGVLSHPELAEPGKGRARGTRTEMDVLSDEFVTLAEVMQAAGYRTAAFVSNPWLKRRFGFAQGFDEYNDSFAAGWHASGEEVVRAGLAWLEESEAEAPYFLYLHTIDSHGPYGRVSDADLERSARRIAADERPLPKGARWYLESQVRRTNGQPIASIGEPLRLAMLDLAYEKGLEDFDRALGIFLEGLATHPALSDTAVLVTSDHGEALFEHGWGNHGRGLFDDEIAVPFAARMPGTAVRGAVDCPLGLIDVMATLCSYLGLACPEPNFGVSFLEPPGPGARPPRYIVSEGVMWRPEHRAIRNEDYKLLFEPGGRPLATEGAPPFSLYAVGADPTESRELLAGSAGGAGVQSAFAALAPKLADAVPSYEAPAKQYAPLDAQTREQLQALGYLDREVTDGPAAGAGPGDETVAGPEGAAADDHEGG